MLVVTVKNVIFRPYTSELIISMENQQKSSITSPSIYQTKITEILTVTVVKAKVLIENVL